LNQNVIIRETSYEIMLQLVDFAYTARIDITGDILLHTVFCELLYKNSTFCEVDWVKLPSVEHDSG